MYVIPNLDLKRDGPTVLEAPAGMLGAFNDAWFRYVQDVGPAGPGQGPGRQVSRPATRLRGRYAGRLLCGPAEDL